MNTSDLIWTRESGDRINCGFREQFIREILPEAWHITPTVISGDREVKVGVPMLAIETNEELFSVIAPFNGFYLEVSNLAMNFPDQIKEDTAIASVSKVKKAKTEAQAAERAATGELIADYELATTLAFRENYNNVINNVTCLGWLRTRNLVETEAIQSCFNHLWNRQMYDLCVHQAWANAGQLRAAITVISGTPGDVQRLWQTASSRGLV